MQIRIEASANVHSSINSIGRTEDVHFSPSNRKLAVAGFKKNTILVLSLRLSAEAIDIDDALTVECDDFSYPHGVFWLGENRLIVANRGRDLAIVEVPDRQNADLIKVSASLVIRSGHTDLLDAPGSVSAFKLAPDLTELLVCNNNSNIMTRHLLHENGGQLAVISTEVVSREGLSIPDGVSYDKARKWAAVSNHNDHSVYIYRVADLGRVDKPAAVLRGMAYPHGLRFSLDGRFLFVADAGAPFIHIFHSPNGEWAGDLKPVDAIRAVDEETFRRGAYNEQEGGPKGVDLSSDNVFLVASCHEQPLAFFKVDGVIKSLGGLGKLGVAELPEAQALLVERLGASRDELGRLRTELAAMRKSWSWKLTTPFRKLAGKA